MFNSTNTLQKFDKKVGSVFVYSADLFVFLYKLYSLVPCVFAKLTGL